MKTDGVATPVVPVLGTPRRRRTRAQVGLVAVFATIVLGAGIGLVGNGFTLPAPSPRPGATSTAGPSSGPSPSSLPSSAPTPSVLCTPVIAGSPPEIRVGRNAADASTVSGLAREGLPGPEASDPPPPAGWPVPPLERVLALDPRYVLRVSAVGEACLYAVLAEYAPADPSLEGPFPIALRTVSLVPAQSRLDLGVLPVGDWIVRVVASFARGPVGAEDGNQTERFFRVRNSEDDVPLPSPEIPPAVPCAALPAAAPAPELVLTGGSPLAEVAGTPIGAGPPQPVAVRLGDPIEIRVAGDACARSWRINFSVPPDPNTWADIDWVEDNPANNPFLFAQNRWLLHDLLTGTLDVTATVKFSADVTVARRWVIEVTGAVVPEARLVAPNGRAVAMLPGGCGASWTFAHGTGGYEYCQEELFPSGLESLAVPPETIMRVEVPGWQIVAWSGTCGHRDPANPTGGSFLISNSCSLGGSYPPDGQPPDGSPLPGPVVFLSRETGPVVRLYLTVARDGDTVSFSVYGSIPKS